uniref:Uncharacterized protein n=1 Tax=Mycolicibacterium sp. CBMA 213 TaxID=1968788 RepID=A0A343VR65_9MYCO|nr:hypothetical protein B5P44_p00094 [Mycolicibacterium sp. CBMA 213]
MSSPCTRGGKQLLPGHQPPLSAVAETLAANYGRELLTRTEPPAARPRRVHPAGASTTAEFCPPMPSEVFRVMPPSMGVGPSRSR